MIRRSIFLFLIFILFVIPFETSTAGNKTAPGDELEININLEKPEEININVVTNSYILSEELVLGNLYSKLTVPGAMLSNESGRPQLPIINKLIGIPANADVEIVIVEDKRIDFYLDQPIIPSPSPIDAWEDLIPGETGYISLPNIEPIETIPENPVLITSDGWIRDQRVVRVSISPFQYIPSEMKITWHQQLFIKLVIHNHNTIGSCADTKKDGFYDSLFREYLINYRFAREWRCIPKNNQQLSFQDWTIDHQNLGVEEEIIPGNLLNQRVKISLHQDGLYQLTALDLANIGISNIDPRTIKLTSQGLDIAYFLNNDNGDGIFDPQESIYFYGQKFNGDILAPQFASENHNWLSFNRQKTDGSYETWKPEYNALMLEKYTNENVYWLEWGGEQGIRMAEQNGAPGLDIPPEYYRISNRSEENIRWRTWPFTSEETWFWERIQTSTVLTKSYPVYLSQPSANGSAAEIKGEIMAALNNDSMSPDHHVKLYLNDDLAEAVEFFWEGKSRFHFEFQVSPDVLGQGENLLNMVVYPTSSIPSEELYFDWFEVSYDKQFKAEGNNILLDNLGSIEKSYLIQDFPGAEKYIISIADPIQPKWITNSSITTSTLKFSGNSSTYYLVNAAGILPADKLSLVETPPNLFDPTAEYVLISPNALLNSTQELANYQSGKGRTTRVVDVQDLYNEFTYGIINPIAIKVYLTELNSRGDLPQYVLLVGDGHFNLKNSLYYPETPQLMPPNLSWVDPWQGEVDSINLLATVVGDDPMPDLVIARLPVNTLDELNSYIHKLKQYEQIPDANWQSRYLFVADNVPDPAGDFVRLSNEIIQTYVASSPTNPAYKLFLANLGTKSNGSFSSSNPNIADRIYLNDSPLPSPNQAIITYLNNTSSLIMNYSGHGTIDAWANEYIFTVSDVQLLNNTDRYPVLLSMTCLDGFWFYPGRSSLVEELIRANSKGVIAAFSPTGLGVATGHDYLQRGFYDSLFFDNDWEMGFAAQSAKMKLFNYGYNLDLLNTFTIFGDPTIIIRGFQ